MSIYDVSISSLDGRAADLHDYEDRAVLLVNVASQCGLTPQYTGLEEIHERFVDRGFTVLGVSSDRPEVSDRSELTALQRVILVGSGVLGYFAVTAGWIVGCGPVGIAVENPPSARLLVPVLVPVLVGLSFSARRTPVRRVPIALALLAVGYVVWLVAMVDTMSV